MGHISISVPQHCLPPRTPRSSVMCPSLYQMDPRRARVFAGLPCRSEEGLRRRHRSVSPLREKRGDPVEDVPKGGGIP